MSDARQPPKYYQVKEAIIEEIDGLPPGSPIADERTLAASFGTSRTTIRQALQELFREGRIMRHQGRGTFVAEPKLTLPLRLSSYTNEMTNLGVHPSSRVLSVATEEADEATAEALGLSTGHPLTVVSRVRLADDIPLAIEVTHLSQTDFPGVAELMTDQVSLYEILHSRFGISPEHAIETIETAPCTPGQADLLETEIGSPMLLMTRQSFTKDGTAFEFVKSAYRGDRYRFTTRLLT